jgi:hypothetical protein
LLIIKDFGYFFREELFNNFWMVAGV